MSQRSTTIKSQAGFTLVELAIVMIIIGLLIGGVLWLSRPPVTLAAEIVTHVQGEPNSWAQTDPLPAAKLDAWARTTPTKIPRPNGYGRHVGWRCDSRATAGR